MVACHFKVILSPGLAIRFPLKSPPSSPKDIDRKQKCICFKRINKEKKNSNIIV